MKVDTQSHKKHNIGASLVATTAATVVTNATLPIGIGIIKELQKIGNLPADKIEILHKAAEQAIKDTGLEAKGVQIKYLKEPTVKNGLKALFMGPLTQIHEGLNAAFVRKKNIVDLFGKKHQIVNSILMPEKGISFASFHEIGHAMNYNLSKIGKALQCMRLPSTLVASGIALYGAFSKTSHPKNGEELTKKQKTKNFIRNNAGKLSVAAMTPILIEEAMATVKGKNLARKLLSPDMFKIVKKGNAIAYLSYLATTAGIGLASWTAVKVKDSMTKQS